MARVVLLLFLSALRRTLLGAALAAMILVTTAALDVCLFAQRSDENPADAAIVLGAAVYGNRPSPVLRERINHAISLYRQGRVSYLIFTGGSGQAGEPAEAEVGRRYALAQGVPKSAILVETTSTNTLQNLANARQVALANGLRSFVVVSTPYHMRRALAIAGDLGMKAYSSPTRTTRWINWITHSRAYGREVAGYLLYLVERQPAMTPGADRPGSG